MTTDQPDHRLRKLERLVEVSRNLGKAQDMETLLHSTVEVVIDLIECEMASILLYEQETDLLKFVAGPLEQREALKHIRVPVEKSVAGSVYRSARPVIVQNAPHDSRIYREVEQQLNITVHNVAAVPLLFRGETVGVLEAVNTKNNRNYTEEDILILEILASQVSLFILCNVLFDEVKSAFDQVTELERLKSNFIAITSHELRTPLGLVLGHASFLNDLIDDPEIKPQFEVIIRSANKLRSIIEELSNADIYRTGAGRLRHKLVSINQLIVKVVEPYLESARQRNITLNVKFPENTVSVDADEEKINIALNNLINNAIAFTDPGGHVLVSAERLPGYVQVSVLDTGIGIPAKDLPHVFDRFFQVQSHLTRRHGGMGLGLSVAKAMIELHQGQIWVESVEGKGSKFYFLLPTKGTAPGLKVNAFES